MELGLGEKLKQAVVNEGEERALSILTLSASKSLKFLGWQDHESRYLLLKHAIQKNYLKVFTELLNQRVDLTVNIANTQIQKGYYESLDIPSQWNSFLQIRERINPLILAAEYGRTEMVRILLGKEINFQGEISISDDIKYIYLSSRYQDQYSTGVTALHLAVVGGHLEIVKMLVENGADINASTCQSEEGSFYCHRYTTAAYGRDGGSTPLHLAVQHKHKDIVDFLLAQSGLDIKRNNYNQLPYELILRDLDARFDIVLTVYLKYLNQEINKDHSKDTGMVLGRKPIKVIAAQALINAGGSAIKPAKLNELLREYAKAFSDGFSQRIAEYLRSKDNSLGITLANYISQIKTEEVTQLLNNRRLDINQKLDASGQTALHLAASQGCTEIVALLLQHPDIKVVKCQNKLLYPYEQTDNTHEGNRLALKIYLFHVEKATTANSFTLFSTGAKAKYKAPAARALQLLVDQDQVSRKSLETFKSNHTKACSGSFFAKLYERFYQDALPSANELQDNSDPASVTPEREASRAPASPMRPSPHFGNNAL